MSTRTLLRSLSLTPDGTLPANKVPPELGVTAPRRGGPIVFEWRIEFVDDDGLVIVGGTEGEPDPGSATVQWHAISFRSSEMQGALASGPFAFREQPEVTTQPLTAAATVDGSEVKETTISGTGWPWPRVTAITAPVVLPKSIRLTVGGATGGTYSIQVDEETALEFQTGLGDDEEAIRDGLVALFADHDLVEATADPEALDELLITALEVGVDFELTLVSPGSILTQAAEQPVGTAATGLRIYMIVDRPAP